MIFDKSYFQKEEIAKINDILRRNKKSTRLLTIVSVCAALVGFTALMLNGFYLNQGKEQAVSTARHTMIVLDSVQKTKDSLNGENIRKAAIAQRASAFLSSIASDTAVGRYYADTVRAYYLKKNASVAEVRKEVRRFNTAHPRAVLRFDAADISVQLSGYDSSKAIVPVRYYRDSSATSKSEILIEMKFDPEGKIYSIRNFESATRPAH